MDQHIRPVLMLLFRTIWLASHSFIVARALRWTPEKQQASQRVCYNRIFDVTDPGRTDGWTSDDGGLLVFHRHAKTTLHGAEYNACVAGRLGLVQTNSRSEAGWLSVSNVAWNSVWVAGAAAVSRYAHHQGSKVLELVGLKMYTKNGQGRRQHSEEEHFRTKVLEDIRRDPEAQSYRRRW